MPTSKGTKVIMKYKIYDKDTDKLLYETNDKIDAEMFMHYNDSVFQKCFNYRIEENCKMRKIIGYRQSGKTTSLINAVMKSDVNTLILTSDVNRQMFIIKELIKKKNEIPAFDKIVVCSIDEIEKLRGKNLNDYSVFIDDTEHILMFLLSGKNIHNINTITLNINDDDTILN